MEKYQDSATPHVSAELLHTPLPEHFPVFLYVIIAQGREDVLHKTHLKIPKSSPHTKPLVTSKRLVFYKEILYILKY